MSGSQVCGATGEPCCAGNVCSGGRRLGGIRIAPDATCDYLDSSSSTTTKPVCDVTSVPTGVCTSATASCGGVGQSCCTSNYSSSTSYLYCGAPGTRCLSGISDAGTTQYMCMPCGDKGQRCRYDTATTSTSNSYGWGTGCNAPYVCTYNSSSNPAYACTDRAWFDPCPAPVRRSRTSRPACRGQETAAGIVVYPQCPEDLKPNAIIMRW